MNTHNKALVIAVGGGSDSVSSLLAINVLKHLQKIPPTIQHIDILCILPSVVDYLDLKQVSDTLFKLNAKTHRRINGRDLVLIDSVVCQEGSSIVPELRHVFGCSLSRGSKGVHEGLLFLQKAHQYTSIIAVDVGGDFIAHHDNDVVLSPMMDGMVGHALSTLEEELPLSYVVMGLGTDGETTTELLDAALTQVNAIEHAIPLEVASSFNTQYRKVFEPIRYARTLDYLLRETLTTQDSPHENPSTFRARFVCKFNEHDTPTTYYGNFSHYVDPKFWGKFYTFNSIRPVNNVFKRYCTTELEWFLSIQNNVAMYNCELNGQFLSLKNAGLEGTKLFLCTPSSIFSEKQREEITTQTLKAIASNKIQHALIYLQYLPSPQEVASFKVYNMPNGLALVSNSHESKQHENLITVLKLQTQHS